MRVRIRVMLMVRTMVKIRVRMRVRVKIRVRVRPVTRGDVLLLGFHYPSLQPCNQKYCPRPDPSKEP